MKNPNKQFKITFKLDKESPEETKYKKLWEIFDLILNNVGKNKPEKLKKIKC